MIEAPHYTSAGSKRDGAFALPAEYYDGTVNEPGFDLEQSPIIGGVLGALMFGAVGF